MHGRKAYTFRRRVLFAVACQIRKCIRPVKTERWGAGVVICLERGADCLHVVQLMPLPSPNPHHLLRYSNPDWFYHSATGLPTLSWKRGHKTGVCARARVCVLCFFSLMNNTLFLWMQSVEIPAGRFPRPSWIACWAQKRSVLRSGLFIFAKACARDYVITGVRLSVCLFVSMITK